MLRCHVTTTWRYLLAGPPVGVDAIPNIKGDAPAVCGAAPKLNPPEGVLALLPNWNVGVMPVLALKLKPPEVPLGAAFVPAENKPDVLPRNIRTYN